MATLLQLRQRTLVLLNDYEATGFATGNGDRFKIPQLNQVINDCYHYYESVLNQFYQGYLSQTLVINALAGVDTYALGASFRSPIYEVRRIINQVNYTLNPLQPYMYSRATTQVPNSSWIPQFWIEAQNIVFDSPPDSDEANAFYVRFQGKLPDLTLDISETNVQMDDTLGAVVIRAAVRLLKTKDVSGALKNISGWEKELVDQEKTMMSQVGNRYIKHDKPIPTGNYEYEV